MHPIVPLNLPKAELQIKKKGEQLYVNCLIRKKSIILTPEEWVRQHFIAFFIDELKYPKGLISVEKKIKYGDLDKRWDLAVFNTNQNCFLLMECKAPNIKITKSVFEQSLLYYKQLQSDYLIMSNGLDHVVMKKNKSSNQLDQIDFFPDYISSE
ncbi:MAG: type I restriction enzyme HsdR N-terminal domain-containing protein [Crocinitomicaceae bacterium]|nr:type I restriction enzyme HsdR N-terminal domain-containing protein [Crocinitomicaceae bacterium]